MTDRRETAWDPVVAEMLKAMLEPEPELPRLRPFSIAKVISESTPTDREVFADIQRRNAIAVARHLGMPQEMVNDDLSNFRG